MYKRQADEIVLTLVNPRQLGPETADEARQLCESATTAVRRTKMSGDMMGTWVYLSDLEPPLVGNGALEVCPPLLSERGAPHMVCK